VTLLFQDGVDAETLVRLQLSYKTLAATFTRLAIPFDHVRQAARLGYMPAAM
jgi:hypothetical protein